MPKIVTFCLSEAENEEGMGGEGLKRPQNLLNRMSDPHCNNPELINADAGEASYRQIHLSPEHCALVTLTCLQRWMHVLK